MSDPLGSPSASAAARVRSHISDCAALFAAAWAAGVGFTLGFEYIAEPEVPGWAVIGGIGAIAFFCSKLACRFVPISRDLPTMIAAGGLAGALFAVIAGTALNVLWILQSERLPSEACWYVGALIWGWLPTVFVGCIIALPASVLGTFVFRGLIRSANWGRSRCQMRRVGR